jgi:hypothetical protein
MKALRRFLVGVGPAAMAVALALCWGGPPGMAHAADEAATHNMLVVGEETVYLSHLPMFQARPKPPMLHRYQVILQVTLAEQERYVKDRREHPTTKIYMLEPELFVLPDLVSTDPKRTPLRSLRATVVRGHLERPGKVPILQNVEVSVQRVTHFRQFDPKAKKPARLEYLLFGKGQELFLAHLITAPPDFDQMLAVKITDHAFTDEELARGVPVGFPGTKNTAASRLREQQRVAGEFKVANTPAPKKIQVEVTRELFLEEGELLVPATFDTTPVEQEAGFP